MWQKRKVIKVIFPLVIYRITAILKVATDTITSITAGPIGRGAILVIIYVETLKLTSLFLSVMS